MRNQAAMLQMIRLPLCVHSFNSRSQQMEVGMADLWTMRLMRLMRPTPAIPATQPRRMKALLAMTGASKWRTGEWAESLPWPWLPCLVEANSGERWYIYIDDA